MNPSEKRYWYKWSEREDNFFRFQVAPYGTENIFKLLKRFNNQYVPTILIRKDQIGRDVAVGIKQNA